MTDQVAKSNEAMLPALREDLQIEEGGAFMDGSPSWLIHDRVRNRFFRIGAATLEILNHWRETTLNDFVSILSAKLNRHVKQSEVEEIVKFLFSNSLTNTSATGDYSAFLAQEKSRKRGLIGGLVHNYLFFKIPLFRPQRTVDFLWPVVRPLTTRLALWVLMFLAVISIYLVSRQWEEFVSTFIGYISLEGAFLYGTSLIFLKVLHEFGHAFMAKKYNIPVSVMGIAFLVLFPVLYTETTAAARLKDRNSRLMIDLGGMLVELAVAVLALLFWIFLPDGPMRSIAFTTATLSWALSLLVNLNPFMRFDGYYVLSDSLGVENLQERGFALAKWRLREILFKPGLPPPEVVGLSFRSFLVLHAWGTWIYRFFLFLGIALFVYGFFIKLVGIALFIIEILWFIVFPIWREMNFWWNSRHNYRTKRSLVTLSCLIFFGLLLCWPWSTRIVAPAQLKAFNEFYVFPPVDGMISDQQLFEGRMIKNGDVLLKLVSPQNDHDLNMADLKKRISEVQVRQALVDQRDLSSLSVFQRELSSRQAELVGYKAKKQQMTIRAPFSGILVNVDRELHGGQWVSTKHRLALLRSTDLPRLDGLIRSEDLFYVEEGLQGTFIPDGFFRESLAVSVKKISSVSETSLNEPLLSSLAEGPIAVQSSGNDEIEPIENWYRIEFGVDETLQHLNHNSVVRGVVIISGRSESYLKRVLRRIFSVLIRESGF